MFAHAYEYDFLTFRRGDGTETKVAVEQLEMTINEGTLLVKNQEQEIELPLQTLQSMYFTATPNSISETVRQAASSIEAYDISGRHVGTFPSVAEAIGRIGSGYYLFKNNGQTQKYVKP